MSDFGFFWNARNHDRSYNADSFSDWLRKFFTNGVFNGDLQVTSTGGMNISVGTGYTNINGKVRMYETAQSLTVDPAYGAYDRIDTVVVERNDIDRNFYLKVVKGGPDGVPIPPVRQNSVYQLVLAQIAVGRGIVQITQSNITDTRMDSDLCGWISGTVIEINYSQITAQWEAYVNEFKRNELDTWSAWTDNQRSSYEEWSAEQAADFEEWSVEQRALWAAWFVARRTDFDNWFAHIQYVLDGDVAGHLQVQIDGIWGLLSTVEYTSTATFPHSKDSYFIYNYKLYRATDDIETGDEISNSDIEEVKLTESLDMLETETSLRDCTTVFNQDGSITQTYGDRTKTTTFNADGSITETVTKDLNPIYSKITVFNQDGSITETVTR